MPITLLLDQILQREREKEKERGRCNNNSTCSLLFSVMLVYVTTNGSCFFNFALFIIFEFCSVEFCCQESAHLMMLEEKKSIIFNSTHKTACSGLLTVL